MGCLVGVWKCGQCVKQTTFAGFTEGSKEKARSQVTRSSRKMQRNIQTILPSHTSTRKLIAISERNTGQ